MLYKFADKQNLEILYSLLIENRSSFKNEITEIINNSLEIYNTNHFTDILSELKIEDFIEPLLHQINICKGDEGWLKDYLYAAINLIEQSIGDFHSPDGLVIKLGEWLLKHDNELSWKSAELLKFSESEKAEGYLIKKFKEKDAFVLTRVACLIGLGRHNYNKYQKLIEESLTDQRDEVKEAGQRLIDYYGKQT